MKAAMVKLSNLFEVIVQAIGSCIFCIVSILCVLMVAVGISCLLTENKPTAAAEDTPAVAENQYASTAENPTAIECGSCGAHVYEYWYVENINDGTPVEVCRYCYENYVANTATEN